MSKEFEDSMNKLLSTVTGTHDAYVPDDTHKGLLRFVRVSFEGKQLVPSGLDSSFSTKHLNRKIEFLDDKYYKRTEDDEVVVVPDPASETA